jgi:hypothetical protein
MNERQPVQQLAPQESGLSAVLESLSSFVRKRPSREGAAQLARYAVECDLSYASTLISAASRYFGEAFRQWSRFQSVLSEDITTCLKHLQHKIQQAKLPSLEQ